MTFTPIILIHVATAVCALMIGGATLALKKGTALHRGTGYLWVTVMLISVLVSFGIRRSGSFSPIHILSLVVLVTVLGSVYAAATGRLRIHRRAMKSAYICLVCVGLLTLIPGRRLGNLLWSGIGLI